ncbi:MAG: NAD(P)/FAD-dependent oxidoreductase [Desulfamplus sp.]|nr:NAD(P)/FAD-dependent oxidoreductase [Desulfamplus sp.]
MKKYLIIGNGIAGTTAAEEIRKNDAQGEITLIAKESLPLYSRIRLPDFLCGKISEKELIIKNQEWHDKKNITLMAGVEIERIDFQAKKVFTNSNDMKTLTFDSLLLSVGSRSFIPPVTGNDIAGVMALRDINDARVIIKKIETKTTISKEMVVIGGGLLGIEVGAALIHAGIKVTVIECFNRLLPRQLDYKGAQLLQRLLENMGFVFRLEEAAEEIIGEISQNAQKLASVIKGLKIKPQVKGVKLKSGSLINAEAVLFSAGVRPDLSLVLNSEIKTDKAVVVNERMETSTPSIYAAGDVAEYQGVNFCIWSEAMEQGRVAGINMSGGSAEYKNIPPSNILKVAGIAVASAGDIDVDGKMDSDIVSTGSVYKKIVKDNNGKIVGCIMVGDTTDFNKIFKQIKGE